MPEGDTIHRTATRLRSVLPGQVLTLVRGQPPLALDRLTGTTVTGVEARGKHLLIHATDGWTLHSHMGMTGSWHLYRPGEAWQKPAHRAQAVLETAAWLAVCFTPKTLELLTRTQLKRHVYLQHLGPDILVEPLAVPEIIERFRRHDTRPLGEAVMDQSIVCGIGNIYKSELLFLERLNPFEPVTQCSQQQLAALVERAHSLMRINLDNAARRTRFRPDGRRFWVYGRHGQACFVCGQKITVQRQGDLGRSTYYCPGCQAPGRVVIIA
jgi:endonuclease-8